MYKTLEETISKTVYEDPQPGMPEPPTGKKFTYVMIGICVLLVLMIIFS